MKRLIYKLGFPIIKIYWFIFRPKIRGVKCVIQYQNKLLFVRHSYGTGRWTFPGGKIKSDESAETAVKREVQEELGIELHAVVDFGEIYNEIYHKKDTITCFTARVENEEFKVDGEEIIEAKWFSIDDLPPMSDFVTEIYNLWKK